MEAGTLSGGTRFESCSARVRAPVVLRCGGKLIGRWELRATGEGFEWRCGRFLTHELCRALLLKQGLSRRGVVGDL